MTNEDLPQDPAAVAEEVVGTASPPPFDLPDDPGEALPLVIEALIETRLAFDARTEDLQRVAAEYENYRKRTAREREEIVLRSTQRLVEALLPVLDSLESALAHEANTPGEEAILSGMESTHQQLLDVLAKEGLETVPAVGEPFDPNIHEAVMGGGDGRLVVTTEMRRGYLLGGRVIRPAMVGVADQETPEAG
ncbi:MAG: nucleotide exchange factor GrpE [Actinomycetota bacterium]